MTRTANEQRPAELLDAIVNYLVVHGVADLSLRPLAKAIGSSPRGLLYYFGSKEKMVDRALARVRENQRALYAEMYLDKFESPSAAYLAIWKHMSAPESEPAFRLFFEVYGLALRQPERFRPFLRETIEDWLDSVADDDFERQYGRQPARAIATILLAGFRGFMLDYCASHDRKRLDQAVSLWLESLETISPDLNPNRRKARP